MCSILHVEDGYNRDLMFFSSGAENKVDAAVGSDDIAHASNFQIVRRFFERLLHLPRSEPSKISTITVG